MAKRQKAGIPLTKVVIDVTADPDGNGGVSWSNDIKVGHANHGHLNVGQGQGASIRFDLDDKSGLGVRFDASGPFFVNEGSGGPCPTSLCSTQCMVDSCEADALVVIDWNFGAARELHYQLNFVNQIGQRINPYDPIIQNGGGGVPPNLA